MRKKDRIDYLNDKIVESKDGIYLYFGTYQQFEIGKNGHYVMEPILWKLVNVTSFKTDGFLLLITKYLIDCKHFGYRCNYETSFIREYLNTVFYDIAFTKREKGKILPTIVDGLEDNVFLLSKEDFANPLFFVNDESRKASCTDVAVLLGGCQDNETNSGMYWTRSIILEGKSEYVIAIDHDGSFTNRKPYRKCPGWHHSFSSLPYETVRPAIRITI
jgi:hypothetical protein